jgi:hypothetical protein
MSQIKFLDVSLFTIISSILWVLNLELFAFTREDMNRAVSMFSTSVPKVVLQSSFGGEDCSVSLLQAVETDVSTYLGVRQNKVESTCGEERRQLIEYESFKVDTVLNYINPATVENKIVLLQTKSNEEIARLLFPNVNATLLGFDFELPGTPSPPPLIYSPSFPPSQPPSPLLPPNPPSPPPPPPSVKLQSKLVRFKSSDFLKITVIALHPSKPPDDTYSGISLRLNPLSRFVSTDECESSYSKFLDDSIVGRYGCVFSDVDIPISGLEGRSNGLILTHASTKTYKKNYFYVMVSSGEVNDITINRQSVSFGLYDYNFLS